MLTSAAQSNGIGNNGARSLAAAVKRNGKLSILNLDSNGIGEVGTKALLKALQHNSSLKMLDLSDNAIEKAIVYALANMAARGQHD